MSIIGIVLQEKVAAWWPNGYGEQKLYPLHFTLKAWRGDSPELRDKTKSHKSLRVGFRTVELVERPAPDGLGNTFLFKVNGVEMFMKGSNYIPSHILPEQQTEDQSEFYNLNYQPFSIKLIFSIQFRTFCIPPRRPI